MMPGKVSRLEQGAAFTLIELMIVILILTVLAGMTAPNFYSGYQKLVLKQTAEDLAYRMRYAQSRAIITGRLHKLEFNDARTAYGIWRRTADSSDDDNPRFEQTPGQLGHSLRIPSGFIVRAEPGAVYFNADGRMSRARISIQWKDQVWTISTRENRNRVRITRPPSGGEVD